MEETQDSLKEVPSVLERVTETKVPHRADIFLGRKERSGPFHRWSGDTSPSQPQSAVACLGFLRQGKSNLNLVTLASLSRRILGKLYLLLFLLILHSVCLFAYISSKKEHLLHDQEKLRNLKKGRVVLRNCLLSLKEKSKIL